MSVQARTTTSSALLDVRGLSVEFATRTGPVQAVRNASINIQAGETVAVVGESASGKSVTAQAIMGILPKGVSQVSAGIVNFDGQNLLALPKQRLRNLCGNELAMVFQDPMSSLNPVMRIGYQITERLSRKGGNSRKEARARAIELLETVGIAEARKRIDDYPHEFSGGMRQRVMIAMAISNNPKLLICDEPTTALDVTVQAQIMELLKQLQSDLGMAMLLISHDLGVVAETANRVYIMYGGSIVETGLTRSSYSNPAHPYTSGLLAAIPSEYESGPRLTPIPGGPPLPTAKRVGCSFSARCRFVTELCLTSEPELRTPAGWPATQQAACHWSEEVLEHD